MPLTLTDYLAEEPTLAAMRRKIDLAHGREARALRADERALVELLENRWRAGVGGWMTPDEASVLALELVATAAEHGRRASAEARELHDGRAERWYLVLTGGRHGHHLLDLATTSPIRARLVWRGYLEACPQISAGASSER